MWAAFCWFPPVAVNWLILLISSSHSPGLLEFNSGHLRSFLLSVSTLEMCWLHSREPHVVLLWGQCGCTSFSPYHCYLRQHSMPGSPTRDSPRNKKRIPRVFIDQSTERAATCFQVVLLICLLLFSLTNTVDSFLSALSLFLPPHPSSFQVTIVPCNCRLGSLPH